MALQNSLTANKQKLGIAAYMSNQAVRNQINMVVGKHAEGFITSIVSAVQTNPALQECTKQSILSAALLGEGLKLSPSPQLGHYYLVPFRNNRQGTTEAQFQLGYKGYLQLAIRSGQYKKINVLAIKEGELVKYDPLEETIEVNLIDDEVVREQAQTIGYYAMFEYTNGFRKAMYWSRQKMETHAQKYSKGYAAHKGYTFWEKDFDAMALKTMIRQLISKWGIMSIEMQTAIEADQAVIREDGTKDYIDVVEEPQEPAQQVTAMPEPAVTSKEHSKTAEPTQADVESMFFGQ